VVFPRGYIPRETIDEDDYALGLGVRGQDLGGWHWDASSTFGSDQADIGVEDSINLSLLADTGLSPTTFHAGVFKATQWTNNLDLSRGFAVGLASPLNLALGVEHRRETYRLEPGDAASRYKEGTVAYPGFSLTDAGRHSRENLSAYAEISVKPVNSWSLSLAGRAEHYDDFGSTQVGKLTTRYDFGGRFALRATASTGFQAPTLQQQYFSATNVGLSQALVQLPANAPAARLLGAKDLRPETSVNLSAGLVAEPFDGLHVTLDAYQIDIHHRILNTGFLAGPEADAAIKANGNILAPGVFAIASYFNNAIDTRTQGVEFSATYATRSEAWGDVDWSLAANFNHTSIRRIAPPPPGALTSLFDPPSLNALTTVTPRSKISLSAVDRLGRWTLSGRLTRYSETHFIASPSFVFPPFYDNIIDPKVIADIEVAYEVRPDITVSVGAHNLFDTYPNETIPASRDRNTMVYPYLSPFGFNGGYCYARLTYRF